MGISVLLNSNQGNEKGGGIGNYSNGSLIYYWLFYAFLPDFDWQKSPVKLTVFIFW